MTFDSGGKKDPDGKMSPGELQRHREARQEQEDSKALQRAQRRRRQRWQQQEQQQKELPPTPSQNRHVSSSSVALSRNGSRSSAAITGPGVASSNNRGFSGNPVNTGMASGLGRSGDDGGSLAAATTQPGVGGTSIGAQLAGFNTNADPFQAAPPSTPVAASGVGVGVGGGHGYYSAQSEQQSASRRPTSTRPTTTTTSSMDLRQMTSPTAGGYAGPSPTANVAAAAAIAAALPAANGGPSPYGHFAHPEQQSAPRAPTAETSNLVHNQVAAAGVRGESPYQPPVGPGQQQTGGRGIAHTPTSPHGAEVGPVLSPQQQTELGVAYLRHSEARMNHAVDVTRQTLRMVEAERIGANALFNALVPLPTSAANQSNGGSSDLLHGAGAGVARALEFDGEARSSAIASAAASSRNVGASNGSSIGDQHHPPAYSDTALGSPEQLVGSAAGGPGFATGTTSEAGGGRYATSSIPPMGMGGGSNLVPSGGYLNGAGGVGGAGGSNPDGGRGGGNRYTNSSFAAQMPNGYGSYFDNGRASLNAGENSHGVYHSPAASGPPVRSVAEIGSHAGAAATASGAAWGGGAGADLGGGGGPPMQPPENFARAPTPAQNNAFTNTTSPTATSFRASSSFPTGNVAAAEHRSYWAERGAYLDRCPVCTSALPADSGTCIACGKRCR